jgi:hypothetical protein
MSLLPYILPIVAAVVIYYFTNQLKSFYFEPKRELDKCKKEINEVLSFNRNKYLSASDDIMTKEELSKISDKIRKVAIELLAIRNIFRRNKFFFMLNILIKDKNLLKAQKSILGLASTIGINLSKDGKNIIRSYEDDIEKALNIRL